MAMPCIKYPVLLLNHTSLLGRTAHRLLFFLHAGQKIKVHDAYCTKIVPPPSTTPAAKRKYFLRRWPLSHFWLAIFPARVKNANRRNRCLPKVVIFLLWWPRSSASIQRRSGAGTMSATIPRTCARWCWPDFIGLGNLFFCYSLGASAPAAVVRVQARRHGAFAGLRENWLLLVTTTVMVWNNVEEKFLCR